MNKPQFEEQVQALREKHDMVRNYDPVWDDEKVAEFDKDLLALAQQYADERVTAELYNARAAVARTEITNGVDTKAAAIKAIEGHIAALTTKRSE